MPKVQKIVYFLDSGSKVVYEPDDELDLTEDAMSTIIKLCDGEDLEEVCTNVLDNL